MVTEKWHALKSPPKTRKRRVISPAQLWALDSLLIDYLADSGCYNSVIFTRRLVGPRSITILLVDSGMATSFPLDISALDSKPNRVAEMVT